MNINDFNKNRTKPIKMITCYDYWTANILANTDIDCILVGDSSAQIMHGAESTVFADINMISTHIRAVKKGIKDKFIIGDMPFMSYRKSKSDTMKNVDNLIKAGAKAIKLEGVHGNVELINFIVNSGIPVMGHVGFTPQFTNVFGKNIVQGKTNSKANLIKDEVKQLVDSGCFSIVLECIPSNLAKEITEFCKIPTIGIGAGPYTNGQVLVLQDLLGANPEFSPKFLKKYADIYNLIRNSVNEYCKEVDEKIFPSVNNLYSENKNDSN